MQPSRVMTALTAVALLASGCADGTARDADDTAAQRSAMRPPSAPATRTADPKADASTAVRLSHPADEASIEIALDVMRGTSETVEATRDQSFVMTAGGRRLGALVTGVAVPGEVTADEDADRICFVAVVADEGTSLVSTVGTGEWQAETCRGTRAVAVRQRGDDVVIILMVEGSTPNADPVEPIVVRWNRSTRGLAVDERWTNRASMRGATTVKEVDAADPEIRRRGRSAA